VSRQRSIAGIVVDRSRGTKGRRRGCDNNSRHNTYMASPECLPCLSLTSGGSGGGFLAARALVIHLCMALCNVAPRTFFRTTELFLKIIKKKRK